MEKWLPMKITHPDLQTAREKLYSFCCACAEAPDHGKTLVIFGENGSGKTRLSKLVYRWFSMVSSRLPLVGRTDIEDGIGKLGTPWANLFHWPTLIDEFQKHQVTIPTDEIYGCNLVVIDDIGAEHDPSFYGREQLYLVLSRREFKSTILTTNLPPDKWDEKFERRIASRLFRNAEHIDLTNVPDFSTT